MAKEAIKTIPALTLVFVSFAVSAADFSFDSSISFGGDSLDTSSGGNEFLLGEGFTFGISIRQPLIRSLSLNSSLGYKFKFEEYSNGTLNHTSIPFSLGLRFNRQRRNALEFGVQTLIEPQINGTLASKNLKLSSEPGIYGEINWKTKGNGELAFRYASDVKLIDQIGNVASAGSFSVIARIPF